MRVYKKKLVGKATFFYVKAKRKKYIVSVDAHGGWDCNCTGAKFRGICSHILGIKSQLQWGNLFPELERGRMQPTPLREDVLLYLAALPRFILHLSYNIREFILLSRYVHVGGELDRSLITSSSYKLSGTIVEAVRDSVDDPWQIWDVLYYKGNDYRGVALLDRLMLIPTIVSTWESSLVEEAPAETDKTIKMGVYRWRKRNVIFKDLGSFYDNKPRSWLTVR